MEYTNIHIACIGARATPLPILTEMEAIGLQLAVRGIGMRSGDADGADTAFYRGASCINPKLFQRLPGRIGHYIEWQQHAAMFHPNWAACDERARSNHARNSAVMLGPSPMSAPEPVIAVVCWTEGGAVIGGTGQALRIAASPLYNIPVFNLAVRPVADFWSWLDGKA